MERIKLAIEKARAQAEESSPLHAVQAVAQDVSRLRQPRSGPASDIVYTRTKVVSLDPAHLARHRVIAANKADPQSNVFDVLRTHLLQNVADNGWRTVAVTAPTPGCGKSTVAVNLALSIARQERPTILLADFDLRRPKIGSYLGLNVNAGLSAYLEGQKPLSDVLVNPGTPGLVVLPNEKPCENAAETLVNQKVQSLVSELSSRYESRLVLFSIPALLGGDDALAFLPNVDCVLLVVGNGKTTKTELEESMRLLQNKDLAGVVLNDPCAGR